MDDLVKILDHMSQRVDDLSGYITDKEDDDREQVHKNAKTPQKDRCDNCDQVFREYSDWKTTLNDENELLQVFLEELSEDISALRKGLKEESTRGKKEPRAVSEKEKSENDIGPKLGITERRESDTLNNILAIEVSNIFKDRNKMNEKSTEEYTILPSTSTEEDLYYENFEIVRRSTEANSKIAERVKTVAAVEKLKTRKVIEGNFRASIDTGRISLDKRSVVNPTIVWASENEALNRPSESSNNKFWGKLCPIFCLSRRNVCVGGIDVVRTDLSVHDLGKKDFDKKESLACDSDKEGPLAPFLRQNSIRISKKRLKIKDNWMMKK